MKSSQLCQVFLVPSGLIGPIYSSGWPVNGHIWLSVCRTDGRAAGVHWPSFGMIPALYIFCVLSFSSNASADLEGGIAPWPGSWGPLT